MSKEYLTEAFKELKVLNEETFSLNDDAIIQAKEFIDSDEQKLDDYEEIIDPLATTEEELQDSYIGKVILDCSVCQSKLYKNPEDVIIDETEELVNVGDECPYCHSVDGYKVIGQVAEYCKDCEEEKKAEEIEDTVDKSDNIEVKETEEVEDDNLEESLSEAKETPYDRIMKVIDKAEMKESVDKPAATSIEDAQKWVDFDMKKYGKISGRTNRLVKKAGFQIIKDDHGDYEVTAGKFESMKEDFEKVDIETDREKMSMTADKDGKVTVTTEPKDTAKDGDEVIAPVEPEVEAEFKSEVEEEPVDETPEDEYIDVDFDEFDEETFDNLGESYLKHVYENVAGFKTTNGSINENTLKLEGLITFKSGKTAKTKFVFEALRATKDGKVTFKGLNEQFAKGKKTYTLTGKVKDKKLFTESLTYNYRGRDNKSGASKRVYGRVSNR